MDIAAFFDNPTSVQDRVYFIAEIGVNHNGDLGLAYQLIDVAVQAGADAVKFQTFTAHDLVTNYAAKALYQVMNTQDDSSQYDMLKSLELSQEAFQELRAYCQEKGIDFLSTPFSFDAVDQLEALDVAAYKVSSGDLTHLPLLRRIAQTQKPVILSTGMGEMDEVVSAVQTIRDAGNARIFVLHCVSNYPAAADECNLRAMDTIAATLDVFVGWSDHTLGYAIPLAAVGMGACIIEKHFTLSVDLPGPDHAASLEPQALAELIAQVRLVSKARGDGVKTCQPSEVDTAKVARRSIVAARDIAANMPITADDLVYLRPGTGLSPAQSAEVIGAKSTRDISFQEVFVQDMITRSDYD